MHIQLSIYIHTNLYDSALENSAEAYIRQVTYIPHVSQFSSTPSLYISNVTLWRLLHTFVCTHCKHYRRAYHVRRHTYRHVYNVWTAHTRCTRKTYRQTYSSTSIKTDRHACRYAKWPWVICHQKPKTELFCSLIGCSLGVRGIANVPTMLTQGMWRELTLWTRRIWRMFKLFTRHAMAIYGNSWHIMQKMAGFEAWYGHHTAGSSRHFREALDLVRPCLCSN